MESRCVCHVGVAPNCSPSCLPESHRQPQGTVVAQHNSCDGVEWREGLPAVERKTAECEQKFGDIAQGIPRRSLSPVLILPNQA